MPRAQVPPNAFALGAAAAACVRGQWWHQALELVTVEMQQLKLKQTTVTYGTAVNACSVAAWWEKSLALLDNLQTERLSASVILCNSVIRSCERAGRWLEALQLLKATPERDVVGFSSALQACAKAAQWAMALAVFDQIPRAGLRQNLHATTGAIIAAGQGLHWLSSLRLLRSLGTVPGAYEAQLRQLRRQAEEEQQALQGEMEALKQAAYNAQAAAAQHRAHVHMACQDLGLRRQQLAAVTGELRRLRAQSLVEQQRLKEEKAQLQQEQQRLAELRSKVSSEGLQLRHALQDAEQRLQYEEQVQRHLQERLRKALAERDQEFHQESVGSRIDHPQQVAYSGSTPVLVTQLTEESEVNWLESG
eukprot:g30031.t1